MHKANWQTTSPGAPVIMPKPMERPAKFRNAPRKPDVNTSAMYKHVVRAIYNNGKRRGYNFRKSASRSSQEMARRQMIKWGYAMRKKKKGGIPDRRGINLTNKGKRRSSTHSREGAGILRAKDSDYRAIVARDPL